MGAKESRGTGPLIREFRGESDAERVSSLLCEAPEATLWSGSDLRKMKELSGVTALVSETNEGISGVVIGRRAADEAEILNLAVQRENRRKGEAKRLLRKLVEEYRVQGVSRVFLEVRVSNFGAIAFYERLGFRPVGRRKDYFQEPKEDALVMELRLWKSTEAT